MEHANVHFAVGPQVHLLTTMALSPASYLSHICSLPRLFPITILANLACQKLMCHNRYRMFSKMCLFRTKTHLHTHTPDTPPPPPPTHTHTHIPTYTHAPTPTCTHTPTRMHYTHTHVHIVMITHTLTNLHAPPPPHTHTPSYTSLCRSVTQISAPVVLSSVAILRDSSTLVAGGADGACHLSLPPRTI